MPPFWVVSHLLHQVCICWPPECSDEPWSASAGASSHIHTHRAKKPHFNPAQGCDALAEVVGNCCSLICVCSFFFPPWALLIQTSTRRLIFWLSQPGCCGSSWPPLNLVITLMYGLNFQLDFRPISSPWCCLMIWALGWLWLLSPGLSCLPHLGPVWGGWVWLDLGSHCLREQLACVMSCP